MRDGLTALGIELEVLLQILSRQWDATLPDTPTPTLGAERDGVVAAARALREVTEELAWNASTQRCHLAGVKRSRRARSDASEALEDWSLTSSPLEVSGLLDSTDLELVSEAAVAPGLGGFLVRRLGLFDHMRVKLTGPTVARARPRVLILTDVGPATSDAFADWLADRLTAMTSYLQGDVLGLFSSSQRLQRVWERTRAQLEPSGIEVMRPTRSAAPPLHHRSLSLSGQSAWRQLRSGGTSAQCVFIDKLDVEPLGRPWVAAREEALQAAGAADAFAGYRLPRALIHLRLGLEQLGRFAPHVKVVVLADPGSPAYRAELLQALADYPVEPCTWAEARRTLAALLAPPVAAPPALVPEKPRLGIASSV